MNGHENHPGLDEDRDETRPASPDDTSQVPGRDEGHQTRVTPAYPPQDEPTPPDAAHNPVDQPSASQEPPARHDPRPTPAYREDVPADDIAAPVDEPATAEPTPALFGPEPPPGQEAASETVPDEGAQQTGPRLDFPRPAPSSRPARIIALANQKGGVGKTTTVINLGAALAELDYKVLLVDMDPQGSLGVGLGIEPQGLDATIYDLLLDDSADPEEVIRSTRVDGLDVMPANIDLAAAELTLVQEVAREHSLRRVLSQVRDRYDFVIIDCPPSLGLLTINGLTASDGVIVPLECEYFALRGMSLLLNTIEKIQSRLNPELELEGIVATMVDTRTLHAREVLARVHEAFGESVFKTVIRRTIRFAEAPVAGEPILTYAPESAGTDAYRDLARELLIRES